MHRWRRAPWLSLPLLVIAVLMPRKAHAKKPAGRDARATTLTAARPAQQLRLQGLIDEVRNELSIPDPVHASVVPSNRLVVSVARASDRSVGFELAVEDGFIDDLTDGELRAVVAHELGHVWIFTHHPYLQTEELANRVALRLIDRRTLEGVYDKVWARVGGRGDITYLPQE